MADVAVQNPKSFLQSNPAAADELAGRWHAFTIQYPDVEGFSSFAVLAKWARENNLPLASLQDLWTGKEITDEYFAERETEESVQEPTDQPTTHGTSGIELLALPLLAKMYLTKLKILEEDKDYQKIAQLKQEEWLKKNPEENFSTKAGIDYLYGSLDNPTADTLQKDTEQAFREAAEKNPKLKKRLEKYDTEKKKIYKKAYDDDAVKSIHASIRYEAQARHQLLAADDETKDTTFDEVQKQVAERTWKRFAEQFPEKAAAYAPQHEDIRKAYTTVLDEKRKQEQEKLKSVEKEKISIAEATKRLETIAEKTTLPQAGVSLINTQGRIISTIPQHPPSSSGLVTTQGRPLASFSTEKSKETQPTITRPASLPQPQQPEEEKKSNPLLDFLRDRILKNLFNRLKSSKIVSRIGQGINSALSQGMRGINSLASRSGIMNAGRLGSLASGSASTAGVGAAGATGGAAATTAAGTGAAAAGATVTAPVWGTVAVVLGLILLIIIIIVFFFGQDATSTPQSPTNTKQVPGLTIALQGPTTVANGADINYSITITYGGTLDVTITDPIPSNATYISSEPPGKVEGNIVSWRLKDIAASTTQSVYTIGIALKPKTNDSIVANQVFTNAPEIVASSIDPGQKSGNVCTQDVEGTGHCAVSNLSKYFGDNAIIASMICKVESQGDPFATNKKCPPDDSVGLFQVNLLAYCPGAYSNPSACVLANKSMRDQCANTYYNPEANIQKAVALSQGGTNWGPWGVWPAVQRKLRECKIIQ